METKKCSQCGIDKEYNKFYSTTTGKLRLSSACKECSSKRRKEKRLGIAQPIDKPPIRILEDQSRTKRCPRCKTIKHASEYHVTVTNDKLYLAPYCKPCAVEYGKERYSGTSPNIIPRPIAIDGHRACSGCKLYFPHEEFTAINLKTDDGMIRLSRYCKECSIIKGRKFREGKLSNESTKGYYRAARLKERYGMTLEQYDSILSSQGGKCAICSYIPNENGEVLAIDHDHSTGKIRGLLCRSCNSGLGYFKDNTEVMRKAIIYIKAQQWITIKDLQPV